MQHCLMEAKNGAPNAEALQKEMPFSYYNAETLHKVPPPRCKSLGSKLSSSLKETFFPDDPFRQFRNQKKRMQCFLGLQYIFPILSWGPQYCLSYFKSDLISGLTIASLSIPQGIAYAKLANLPPVVGLYSSFVPPLMYSILGSSREVAAGPSAILSIVLGTMLRSVADPVKEPNLHLYLAFTVTFFVGIFQAALGFLRLGFIIDFLSHATISGFVSGVAIIICLQQLKEMLGLMHFTIRPDIISVVHTVFQRHDEWSWRPIVIAVCFVTFLLTLKYISTKRENLFWVSAMGPLTSVVVTTFFVWITRADEKGLRIVGHLKEGINPLSANKLIFHGQYLVECMKIAMVVGMISLMEGIAVGRTFSSIKGYHIDGNKEMIAIGVMNLAGSCTSCYATTGALARSAVNFGAGCKTAVSNIVLATIVMITLLVLMPLFHFTPNVILASIIFSAVIGLVDPVGAFSIWKVDKFDFLAYLGAFLGVLFISIPLGLAIAVALSIIRILLHMSRPHTSLLGQISGSSVYKNVTQYPEANKPQGIVVVRIDAAMFFCNANYIRERVLRWVEEEDINKIPVQFLVLDMNPVTIIDTTGIRALGDIRNILLSRNVTLAIANASSGVLEKLYESKFIESLGQEWIFSTVGKAVEVCSMRMTNDTENC